MCDGSAHSSGCVVNGYGCLLSYYLKCLQNQTSAVMLAVVHYAQERVMDALLARKPDLDHQDKVCLFINVILSF